MRRWMIASIPSIVAGVVAALLAGSILEPTGTVIGLWGAVCGIAAALLAFVASWTLPGRPLRMSRAWRIVVAVALGLLATAAAWWVTMWGVPPWTLEGAWMYAILLLAGTGSLALSMTLRRGR